MADTPDCGGPDRCINDMCRGNDEGICGRLSDAALDEFAIYDDDDDEWTGYLPARHHEEGDDMSGRTDSLEAAMLAAEDEVRMVATEPDLDADALDAARERYFDALHAWVGAKRSDLSAAAAGGTQPGATTGG